MTIERPKPPRRDCKNIAIWRRFYECMAHWHAESEQNLRMGYQASADHCRAEAESFAEAVKSIDLKTHPNILSGVWK